MIYVKVENGIPVKYSIYKLRQDNPNISFPSEPSDALLAGYSVYPLTETDPPSFDQLTEKVIEVAPVKIDGVWTQQWEIVDLTEEEIQNRRAQTQVSMRQARLALLNEGFLSQIEAAIASLPAGQKEAAEIEWEYGSNVERLSPWVVQITSALGMTDEQVDELFAYASTL